MGEGVTPENEGEESEEKTTVTYLYRLGLVVVIVAVWLAARMTLTTTERLRALKSPLVCAHGGAHGGDIGKGETNALHLLSGPRPNTDSSLRAALAAGYPCVEVDASLSVDKSILAAHARDFTEFSEHVERFSGSRSALGHALLSATLPVLPSRAVLEDGLESCSSIIAKRIDSLRGGDGVISLDEALQILCTSTTPLQLLIIDLKADLKTMADSEVVLLLESTAQTLAKYKSRCSGTKIVLASKVDKIVNTMQFMRDSGTLPSTLSLAYVVMNGTLSNRVDGVHEPIFNRPSGDVALIHHKQVDAHLVRQLASASRMAIAWTVESEVEVKAMVEAGVHAIITNRPFAMVKAIRDG